MYEPLRPIHAPEGGAAFLHHALFGELVVHWGEGPSRSYWIVPGVVWRYGYGRHPNDVIYEAREDV